MDDYEIGMLGEEAVACYLDRINCHILERNFRTRSGEIDIIFEESGCIVFGEVKTRRSFKYGRPLESVNHKKRLKIISLAKEYMFKYRLGESKIRFDVFEVFYYERKIRHIRNAFFSI
ncbi:MAG: YraN family protein [Peptostreptococcus sp.]|uniref:YraN family protein n=1 Tax=Peptostreptococcus sp. TaxID=1262 RepID=UPI002FCC006D